MATGLGVSSGQGRGPSSTFQALRLIFPVGKLDKGRVQSNNRCHWTLAGLAESACSACKWERWGWPVAMAWGDCLL